MARPVQKCVQPLSAEPACVERLLKAVLRSRLLDREKLQDALRDLALDRRDDPESVADHLVKSGKLSRFQARKLLQGQTAGLVLGPFQILAPVGKGGMGTVYLARDTRSEQLLALKVLTPKKARDEPRLLARFRREMEMCQRVAHPHIAWTCDVGVCQGVYYIAMEYIPGKSLYRIVSDGGPLEVSRAARLFAEIAAALDHTHHQGLIHRDLKPSNIQVTPNDHAKLLDLGLALMQGETVGAREVVGGQGYVVGTMDYIAPEQAQDAAGVDPRSDIYALGSTLYFALTGRPPFPGGTTLEKLQHHRDDEPPPVEQHNAKIPPRFGELVRRMMAKNPNDRFPNAHLLQNELQAWVNGEPARPLDRAGDMQFQQAVLALENAEPEEEEIEEAMPAGESEPVGVAVLIEEEVIPVGKLVDVIPGKSAKSRTTRQSAIPPVNGKPSAKPLTAASGEKGWGEEAATRPMSTAGLLLLLLLIAALAVAGMIWLR
jgi:serine/threonine protein kinase